MCVYVWDLPAGKLRSELGKGSSSATALCFTEDGKTLVTGHSDGFIRQWNIATGKEIKKESIGHKDLVMSVVYSPDSKFVISAGKDKSVRKWEVKTGKLLWTVASDTEIMNIAYAPDGKTIAVAVG